MKKSALMAILCMLWGACPASVSAQEIQLQEPDGGRLECLTEEGEEEAELLMQASGVFSHMPYKDAKYSLTYRIDLSGVRITGYSGKAEGELVIPAEIDGVTVYAIEYGALRDCSGFTGSLKLPEGLTSIGDYAFSGCKGFTGNLELPESLTRIGNYAFRNCGFTGNLELPEGLTSIGNSAFIYCGFTGNLELPKSLISIGNYAFSGCKGFTGSLKLPESLTNIGDYAFASCAGFSGSLELPKGLTGIGNDVFSNCGFTGSLKLPEGLINIGNSAFAHCKGFTGNLELPEGLTSIGNSAFTECGFTGSLKLPKGLISIGNSAFGYCKGFTGNLELPEGLTSIGDYTFANCVGLTGSLELPKGLTSIGNSAFSGCKGFTGNLELPEGLTSIGNSAFLGCKGFTGNLELPKGLTDIGDYTFANCVGFTGGLKLPEGLARIGSSAFEMCYDFTSIVIPESATSIGTGAFRYCGGVTGVSIPAGMNTVGAQAFAGCGGLTNIYFGGSPGQWASIAIEPDNELLTGANIYYNTYYASGDSMPALTDNGIPAAVLSPAAGPAESSNLDRQEYSTYGTPVNSYLYDNGSGLTRVEYTWGKVVIENYDPFFQYQSGYTLEPELPLWGGFFAGEKYNFLIFGQNNPEEDDTREVIRVVKYDKNWNRISHVSLYGANTVIPFRAGSLRCDEYNGMLYVHTCHQMYKSDDGLNHQANMTFSVREVDMKITDSAFGIGGGGYASHSFNQFLLVDAERNIVIFDQGDAYPRSAFLQRFEIKAGKNMFYIHGKVSISDELDVKVFPGETGDNETGASLGGLAETESGYLAAYNYSESAAADFRSIYISYIPKENISLEGMRTWSSASAIGGTPVIASMGQEGGYVLWNNYVSGQPVINYVRYDAQGNISQVQADENLRLSDCQPIVYQGKLVWYVTAGSAPVFYTIPIQGEAPGLEGLAQGPDGGWYYYRNGVVDTSFSGLVPNETGWWCVENGSINFGRTGLVNDPNVGWWYVENGSINFGRTGLVNDPNVGWWYVENGSINFGYTGLVCDPNVGWWYVENGSINFGYTGLVNDPNVGWWYVENGSINFGYTGLVCDPNVGWWYVENGSINFGYTGLVCAPNVGWWYVENGSINFGYTGLVCDPNVGWWYVENGSINFGCTGLVNDPNVGWWYVENGSINFGFNGLVGNEDSWWYVENGTINFGYTGFAANEFGTWYVVNGSIFFDYTGPVQYGDTVYQVVEGMLVN